MIELENCAYRIMRLLGVHHQKTVELATPDIVKELEHLTQAENATLKARNRHLVEALEKISKMGAVCQEFEICEHPPCNDSARAVLESLQALKTHKENLAND